MARSGTTWVGRMLCASGALGYVNEPFNLSVSPGTIRIPVDHWYTYITADNEDRFLPALTETLAFRYPLRRELSKCRSRTDVHHTLKMWGSFVSSRDLRPLVKDPHAVFSAQWFAERLGSDVVVTVRHPAAVVSSWKRLGWTFDFRHLLEQPDLLRDRLEPFRPEMEAALSPTCDLVDRIALLWRVIYHVVAEYRDRFPEFHVVRQEDLSQAPRDGFARLYAELGLPLTDEANGVIAASSGSQNPRETPIDLPHETRIDSAANLESWKARLSAEEFERVRRITGETATLYYADSDWPRGRPATGSQA
jgi:hypothetical protein